MPRKETKSKQDIKDETWNHFLTFATMTVEEIYMQRCLELASNGLGNVAPNPMVGAVVVEGNKIIGEGFHQQFGKAHAEVNAVNDAISKYGEEILTRSDLYVNLEPCTHSGKTPPCVDLIIGKKIKKVIIGCTDPFEKVKGTGIKKLSEAGIEIKEGILNMESRNLNKRFIKFHEESRPYIILKHAQSLDGFISPEKITPENRWITNEQSRQLVHRWRSEEQAIMVGTNTALMDNPSLTVRDWKGKNPLRVVIDRELKLKRQLNLFNGEAPALVFNSIRSEQSNQLELIRLDFTENIFEQILNSLYQKNIQSVIVEGGSKLLQAFIDENLWDEARIFIGNKILGSGVKAPAVNGKVIAEENISEDKLIILSSV